MRRFLKIETWLYVIVVLGIISSGSYLIFSKPEVKRKGLDQESLGYVRPLGQDVRLRGNQETSWNKLGKDTHVYQDDRVFTGSTSSAHVRLKGAQQFTVEPNSLVKITDDSNAPIFDLESGSFFGELRKGTKFFVKSGGETAQIESTGAVIRLETYKKKIKLTVFKGEASVQTASVPAPQKVKANEAIVVAKEELKVEPLEIVPLAPAAGSFLWKQNQDAVTFNWKSSRPNAPVVLEVSLDPLFREQILTKNVQGESFQAYLKSGQIYFWRVRPTVVNDDHSAVSSFSYYASQGPKILPDYTLPIQVDGRGVTRRPVNFSWNDASLSDSYELQISETENFSAPLYSKSTTSLSQAISGLRVGQYYWRVISKHPAREDFVSITARIELQNSMPAPIEAPEVTLAAEEKPLVPEFVPLEKPQIPKQNLNFELFEKNLEPADTAKNFIRAQNPVLNWKASNQAEKHTLEMSAHSDFKTLQTFALEDLPWVWDQPRAGLFFVRVKAERAEESAYSEVRSIRTLIVPPELKAKVMKANDGQLAEVQLSFKSHSLAGMTEVQTSTDENFKAMESFKAVDANHMLVPKKPGSLHIRVRSLNSKGWPISRFSQIQKVLVPKVKKEVDLRRLASVKKAEEASVAKLDISEEMKFLLMPKVSVWVGAGGDLLQFNQSSSNELTNGTFSKMMMPALMMGVGFRVSDKSSVNLQYHDAPGEVSASTDTDVTKTTYHWRSAIAEWQYELLQRGRVRYNLLFGGQIHQIPFLYVDDLGTVSVLQNELDNLSVGFKANYLTSSRYSYEAFFRYQQLVGSKSLDGNTFSASSQLIFDGSVGVTKLYTNGMRAGVFWFGQSQNVRYSFSKDGLKSSGTQSFFGSTFQFRFGYDFF